MFTLLIKFGGVRVVVDQLYLGMEVSLLLFLPQDQITSCRCETGLEVVVTVIWCPREIKDSF